MRARGERVDIEKLKPFARIYVAAAFGKEFDKTVGFEKSRYQNWLDEKLRQLDTYSPTQLARLMDFEKLQNIKQDIYAIRKPRSKLNPRVLYVYNDGNRIVLLTAFAEKRKSDYSKGVALAIKRMKEWGLG